MMDDELIDALEDVLVAWHRRLVKEHAAWIPERTRLAEERYARGSREKQALRMWITERLKSGDLFGCGADRVLLAVLGKISEIEQHEK